MSNYYAKMTFFRCNVCNFWLLSNYFLLLQNNSNILTPSYYERD